MTQDAPTPAAAGTTTVQSLARGLAVIRAFDADHPSMTLTEVAARTDLSRATARRFLFTLRDLGYVRDDGKNFELTPQVLDLGYAYLSSARLPQLLEPILKDLSAQVAESASASVLDGADVVYIARVHTRAIMRAHISVGTRFPAVVTSMGRVILAYQDPAALPAREIASVAGLDEELLRVREQGYAIVDQELEAGLRSVAVPVLTPAGTVAAAINVSMSVGPQAPLSAQAAADEVLPALLRAAERARIALAPGAHQN